MWRHDGIRWYQKFARKYVTRIEGLFASGYRCTTFCERSILVKKAALVWKLITTHWFLVHFALTVNRLPSTDICTEFL